MYTIPVIPQNLRRDETIVQIADALYYLSQVAEDIFNRVNNRIAEDNKRLKDVSIRIDAANAKIGKLSGAKSATQVFSSSKYPAGAVYRQYVSLFDSKEQLPFRRTVASYKNLQTKEEPIEILQFYHVKVHNTAKEKNSDGLGNIPQDIDLVNDLLLYNTGKNPYKKYVMSDPLQVSQRVRKEELSDSTDIGAAPLSISERTALTRSATASYFYSPDLGHVPAIDVPIDLPDLPGVADDLRYINETCVGIAPSVTTTPNVPDLPLLQDVSLNDVPEENNSHQGELLPLPPSIQEITVEHLPPVVEVLNKTPESTIRVVQDLDVVEHEKAKLTKPVVTDAHANLMEAIRNVGGLKSAKLKTTEPKEVGKLASISGGDLMADLHAKLSLRRKGISGTKAQDSSPGFDTASALNKISAMIPPPPTRSSEQAESTNTEDEEWDE